MASKTTYIKYFADIDYNNVKNLMDVVQAKLKDGTGRFVILISCLGGSVFHGLSAYNFLRGIPAEVETHNFGSVVSMGIVLFCAGKKRYSVPHATFLVHGVQANFPQGAGLEEKQLEERLKGLKLDTENIAGVVAACTGKTEEDVIRDMLDRTTLNPEQALKYGLIHEIKEALFESGAELISIQS